MILRIFLYQMSQFETLSIVSCPFLVISITAIVYGFSLEIFSLQETLVFIGLVENFISFLEIKILIKNGVKSSRYEMKLGKYQSVGF